MDIGQYKNCSWTCRSNARHPRWSGKAWEGDCEKYQIEIHSIRLRMECGAYPRMPEEFGSRIENAWKRYESTWRLVEVPRHISSTIHFIKRYFQIVLRPDDSVCSDIGYQFRRACNAFHRWRSTQLARCMILLNSNIFFINLMKMYYSPLLPVHS